MNRIIQLALIPAFLFLSMHAYGQNNNGKEEKPPVFNYVIDDPMDKFQAQKDTIKPTIVHYRVPEFYFHTPRKIKDTTFEFFCYDVHDSLMSAVYDYDSVFYYSLYKSYTDSAHTYTDNQGKKQFLPVSNIYKRYDKVGNRDKWITIEYPGNKYGELRAFKNVFVSSDTVKVNSSYGDLIYLKIYHYYKLIH